MIGLNAKSTFSLSKNHCSLWLDFFVLDVFSPKRMPLVKQKAALDADVAAKPLEAVCFAAAENNPMQVIFTVL